MFLHPIDNFIVVLLLTMLLVGGFSIIVRREPRRGSYRYTLVWLCQVVFLSALIAIVAMVFFNLRHFSLT